MSTSVDTYKTINRIPLYIYIYMRLPRSPRPWSLDISARPQNMDILGKWYVNWLSAVRAVPAHLTQGLPYAFEIPSDFVL